MITFEYGAMSSKYSLEAPNKFTAYVAMIAQYDSSAHMVAIYSPEENKADNWMSLDGKVSERLDEIFGGPASFDKYVKANLDEIKACLKTIKQLI